MCSSPRAGSIVTERIPDSHVLSRRRLAMAMLPVRRSGRNLAKPRHIEIKG